MMLNKEPIYLQINKALQKKIETEGYNRGDKFLTERAICELFEVSRATANKALSSLVSQNILEFKKGVGTFIQSIPLKQNKNLIFSNSNATSEIILEENRDINDLDLHIKRVKIPSVYSEIRLRKTLFRIDSIPIVLEERYTLGEYDSEENEDIIEIQSLTEAYAEILQSEPGKPGFVISTIFYNGEHIPVEIVKTIYKPDSIRLIHKDDSEIEMIL